MAKQTTFDQEFLSTVMEKYGEYIKRKCIYSAGHQIFDPMWGPEDIEQELYLKIWRFCTEVSKDFSKNGKIWLPYMDMMIRNVIGNLLKPKIKWRDMFDDRGRFGGLAVPFDDVRTDSGKIDSIDLKNYLVTVRKRVKPSYRKYFDELTTPSWYFREFIIENTKPGRTVIITKQLVSKYFGIAYCTTLLIFKHIEKSFVHCEKNI